jgi:hypothetical protein
MKNLSENAKQLSGMSDAVNATDGFITNVSKASESVRNLTVAYDKTTDSLEHPVNKSQNLFYQC